MIDTRRLLEFDFTDKRVTVVGLGVEGVDMVRFLSRHHAEVTVSDSKTPERLAEQLARLEAAQGTAPAVTAAKGRRKTAATPKTSSTGE